MGDRTECTLELSGILSETDVDRLVSVIHRADPSESSDRIKEYLLEGVPEFTFEEVNYAVLDDTLSATLMALHITFIWRWFSGDEYGPGVKLYDALTGRMESFCTVSRDIAITLRDIDTEGRIEEIRQWDKILNGPFPFVVFRSNHHLMELKARGELPQGYFELRSKETS